MSTEELLQRNNKLMESMVTLLSEIKCELTKQEVDTVDVKTAMAMLGVNNQRFLTYLYGVKLLDRRRGGSGFLYFKKEVKELADKINEKKIALPPISQIYNMLKELGLDEPQRKKKQSNRQAA